MLCAIYKSPKKLGAYLYIEKKDQFDQLPTTLLDAFGKPIFVMYFNLKGQKSLVNANNQEVLEKIQQQGFYLQFPKENDWLFSIK